MSYDNSSVRYELEITPEEARIGGKRLLTRNGKKLEVTIPPGVKAGSRVKLTNALQVTDSRAGDILIYIKVKDEEKTVAEGVIEVQRCQL